MKVRFTPSAWDEWQWWEALGKRFPFKFGKQVAELDGRLWGLPEHPEKGPECQWAPGYLELVTARIRLLYIVDTEAGVITVEAVVDTRMAPDTVLRRLG